MNKANKFREYWEDKKRWNGAKVDDDINESAKYFTDTMADVFNVLNIHNGKDQFELMKNNYRIALERYRKALNDEETTMESLYISYVAVKGADKAFIEFVG